MFAIEALLESIWVPVQDLEELVEQSEDCMGRLVWLQDQSSWYLPFTFLLRPDWPHPPSVVMWSIKDAEDFQFLGLLAVGRVVRREGDFQITCCFLAFDVWWRRSQVEELQQEIEELRRSLKKDYARAVLERKPKAIKDWLHAAETTTTLRPQGPKKQDAPVLESLQDPVSRRNTSVTIDALTDAEEELSPDKQKWLSLHPYAPIPNLPFALAKYPHSPALFISKRNEISRRLEKLLREELLKFGIPPNAEGISDAKYAVVAAALEKQRAFRLSSAAPSEKRVMEYERSTILWHIERAVHSRDMSILESIFDEETESASGNDANAEDPCLEDDETLQSPTSIDQLHRFERNLSGRRSFSHQGSELSGRSRDQLSDVLAISRNPASPSSIDDLEPRTFQVIGQLTTQRVPSLSDEQPPQCNIILSAVSSPTALVPEHPFENFEENAGLGDWESDGEGDSSFAQSSPRRIGKEDNQDFASASSKNTAKLSDLDRMT
ncbi:hypothetical protein L7F22_024318 [Adiantum nelumboides]|nr:hypothetical protein [Adiantum nelumboides]